VRATRTDKKLLTLRDGDVNRGFGFLVGMDILSLERMDTLSLERMDTLSLERKDILSLERMEGGGGGGGGGQTE